MSNGSWKFTPLGRFARYVGSVRFAVPLLTVVAAAMVWGTWIDSTVGRERAMGAVYGSWWFITLMVFVCASLIISVLTRYPWKRKHIGFITVHASLIGLIVVGFYTMFTKLEGRIILEEGHASTEDFVARLDASGRVVIDRGRVPSYMQMDGRQIELLEGSPGEELRITGAARLGAESRVALGGEALRIVASWANSAREMDVTNDRPDPFHAAEVSLQPGATSGMWIEEGSPTPVGDRLVVRVMPAGERWTPPSGTAAPVLLDAEGSELALPSPGEAVGDSGWSVQSVEQYQRATIAAGGISEREDGPANPAVKVVLQHADGATERHIAFERFRDSPFRTPSSEVVSPFTLTYRGESFSEPTLAIMRDADGSVHALYAEPGAEPVAHAHEGGWPWVVVAGSRHVTVLRDYDRAMGSERLVEAPEAENNRPVLLVAPSGVEREPTPLLWNQPTPVELGGRTRYLRYGPIKAPLPFDVQLVDFRRTDYPGSQMAMAYESDVRVTLPEQETVEFNIHMNHPFHHGGWKVYQSGFQGETVSIFQVTRDPGLPYMYLFCTTLCIGILVTFYSRSLSWGHPDIPAPFQEQPQ